LREKLESVVEGGRTHHARGWGRRGACARATERWLSMLVGAY